MESMLNCYNNWNPNTLRKAQENLMDKEHNSINLEEIQIISTLLDCKYEIIDSKHNDDFIHVFQDNNRIFEEEYTEYMKYIIDFYEKPKDKAPEEPYKVLRESFEYIMAKLDNFIESLDSKWYEIFQELYAKRKDVIRVSNNLSKTLYLPNCDLWLANIQNKGTIEDYANITKIFSKGIAAKLHRKYFQVPNSEILIEAFAKAIQEIFIANLDDYEIQGEITKYFNKNYNDMLRRVESVYEKFVIDALISNPESANQLANMLSECSIINTSEEYLKDAYKRNVKGDIQEILTDMIVRELLLIYDNNKEQFISNMNALVTSKESPVKTLEKLNIELNSIYHR